MKLRRLRDGDVPEDGDVVLVRAGDLHPDILSEHAGVGAFVGDADVGLAERALASPDQDVCAISAASGTLVHECRQLCLPLGPASSPANG